MNLPSYVFDLDYVAKIRSGICITVLEKKKRHKNTAQKSDLRFYKSSNGLDIQIRL